MLRRQTNHCHVIVRAMSFPDYLLMTYNIFNYFQLYTHKSASKLTNDPKTKRTGHTNGI